MGPSTLADLAQGFHLARHSTALRDDLSRLTLEVSSGKTADLGTALRGDFAGLAAVERGLQMAAIYETGIDNAALLTAGMQGALETVQAQLTHLAPAILGAGSAGGDGLLQTVLADAPARLDQALSALNTHIAGRSLFAGDQPDQPALASADALLGALGPVLAGSADAQEMETRLETWIFAPGGGFETVAYLGGEGPPPGVTLGQGDRLALPTTALAPEVREALFGLLLAAAVDQGLGPQDPDNRQALAERAATRMMEGQDHLATLRADIGSAEARIETARVRNQATEATLALEQLRLTKADPFDAAAELETVQRQLENLYLLTARMARLSLAEFLR